MRLLLVDSATQPMQAAPLAAMREGRRHGQRPQAHHGLYALRRGQRRQPAERFGEGPARPGFGRERARSLWRGTGRYAERALRQRLERARFFLADLHVPLSDDNASGRRTISQLRKLLDAIDAVIERPQPAEARPVYDRMNLVLAIRSAADAFHETWRPRLGLEFKPGFAREHWTQVKALSRRLATGWADEYDTLRPIADLRKELVERVYVFVQNPLRWEGVRTRGGSEADSRCLRGQPRPTASRTLHAEGMA